MLTQYSTVLIFILLSIGFILITLLLGSLLRPHNMYPVKLSSYECGEIPVGKAWVNFNIRYYSLALVFLLFDVEIVFILPVAVVYREWIAMNFGLIAMVELVVFVSMLIFALVYVWGKGDISWIKSLDHTEDHTKEHTELEKAMAEEEGNSATKISEAESHAS